MRKICSGPMQMEPYRPWSEERRQKAMGSFWIGERGRRAEEMFIAGYTFKEIAAALGTTRSAVGGYLGRNGVKRKDLPDPNDRPAVAVSLGDPNAPFGVYEVFLEPPEAKCAGRFWDKLAAQLCANKAFEIDGSVRMVFHHGRYTTGIAWKDLPNSIWAAFENIAKAALAANAAGQSGRGTEGT